MVSLAVSEGESLKSRDASRNIPAEKRGTAGDLPNLGRQWTHSSLSQLISTSCIIFIGEYPSKQMLNAPFGRSLPLLILHIIILFLWWTQARMESHMNLESTDSFGSTKVFHFHFVVKRFSPHQAPLPLQTADWITLKPWKLERILYGARGWKSGDRAPSKPSKFQGRFESPSHETHVSVGEGGEVKGGVKPDASVMFKDRRLECVC